MEQAPDSQRGDHVLSEIRLDETLGYLEDTMGIPAPPAHVFAISFLEGQRNPAYAVRRSINDFARAEARWADYYDSPRGLQGDWGEHLLPVVATSTSADSARCTGGGGSGAVSPIQQPLALIQVRMENNPYEAFGYELPDGAMYSHDHILNQGCTYTTGDGNNTWGQNQNLRNILQRLTASQVFTRSSGGISKVRPAYALEALLRFCNDLARGEAQQAAVNLLDADHIDLEAGQQGNLGAHLQPVVTTTTSADSAWHTGSGAVPPIQEPVDGSWGTSSGAVSPIQEQGDSSQGTGSGAVAPIEEPADGSQDTSSGAIAPIQQPAESANMPEGVMVQAFGSILPACATVYSVLNDAPDYIKFTTFLGLASITVALFVGIQSRTVARRQIVMRLVSFLAISVLTFIVASQLTGPIYVGLTAFLGVVVNLLLILLQFR